MAACQAGKVAVRRYFRNGVSHNVSARAGCDGGATSIQSISRHSHGGGNGLGGWKTTFLTHERLTALSSGPQ